MRMAGKRLKKDVDIPNLWPWKAEMLKQRLARMKEFDAEQERKKQTQRKEQIKKKRQQMLLKAITHTPKPQAEEEVAPSSGLALASRKWYRKELAKVVETADVIIEVLDARDPLACRCRSVENKVLQLTSGVTGKPKKLILLLNKIDLVPTDVLEKWIRVLRREFPVIAFKCNTQNQKNNLSQAKVQFNKTSGFGQQAVGSEALLQLLKNYCRSLNLKTSITVGFIGYPNTGKSSVINSLKRTRAAGTSGKPGFTTSLQEIRLDQNIKLIDSPGVLLNDSDDVTGLVLKNAIRVDQVDGQTAIAQILERCPKEALMQVYKLPDFNSVQEFLFLVAQNRGKLKKGGVPDVDQAATLVLQEWNSGKIPFYVEPPEMVNNDDTSFVSQFSQAFDIDALLHSNYQSALKATKANLGKRFVAMSADTPADDVEMS